jgi:hypothetical protein
LRVIAIDLSMDGRVSRGGDRNADLFCHMPCRSPSWPFVDGGGGPLCLFVGACRSWWWVLVASGPSSPFIDSAAGRPWTFMGGHCCSSIVVVDPCSQSSMVVVGARCVSWGLPEESVVVMCDIVFVTSPNWDVSNSVAFLSFVTLCRG